MKASPYPTFRYILLQGSYWFSFCVTYCFISVFLLSYGFTNTQIGLIIAIAGLVSAILQPVLGGLINEEGRITMRRTLILLVVSILIFSLFIIIFSEVTAIMGIFFCLVVISLQTINPFVNALGMECINRGIPINFGLGRGMGSISYAIASVIMGKILVKYPVGIIPWCIIICFSLALIIVITFTYQSLSRHKQDELCSNITKNQTDENAGHSQSFFKKYPGIKYIMCGIVLVFITHNIVNTYLYQICQSVGAGAEELGIANGICAFVELPTMLLFSVIVQHFSCKNLLKISGVFFGVRALLHLLAASAFGIYLAQLPQMVGFALFIPASTYYANELMHPKDRAKGQTYLCAANSIGNLGGSALGGLILDYFGIAPMLVVGIVASFIGTAFFIMGIRNEKTT